MAQIGESSVDDIDTKTTININQNANRIVSNMSQMTINNDDIYRMDHKCHGYFLIINNKTFYKSVDMTERTGTDVDAESLKIVFESLGFNVYRENNCTVDRMKELMKEVRSMNHEEYDCFGAAFLSHGDEGIIYGTDGSIQIDVLLQPVKMCKSLIGKPKLFFFQACRGTQLDAGHEVQHDAPLQNEKQLKIPIEADFLYAFSTVPGYFSWRNSSKGSWFVQALRQVLEDPNSRDLDIIKILTRVNKKVSLEFHSNASQEHMNRKKQVPSIVSMLTKDLYLRQEL